MATVEEIVEQSMLYDFYGELLTEHQRSIYESAHFEDLSLSEIAEQAGISRQGVHDLLKRCDKQLRQYEEKLHLVDRFEKARKDVELICVLSTDREKKKSVRLGEIEKIAKRLIDEL